MSKQHFLTVNSILQAAQQDIQSLAAETGIAADEVLAQLPSHGQLWVGPTVPVIARRYRGCCSVLFYCNPATQGQTWPYLRFHTFKDGGIVRILMAGAGRSNIKERWI